MIKTLKVIIATSARSIGIVISFKMRLFNVLEIMICSYQTNIIADMGVARGKSGWGSFPKGRRPRAGCGAWPHVAAQAKIFWVLDGGRIPRI